MAHLIPMIAMSRSRVHHHYRDRIREKTPANTGFSGRSRLTAFAVLAIASAFPVAALAQVPDEFLGKWTTDPTRCQQINGEVDMLEVMQSGFQFYEIGCDVKKSTSTSNRVTLAAQCWKGGSPVSSGTVVMRRLAPDRIDVSLRGFFWITEEPEAFHRCKVD